MESKRNDGVVVLITGAGTPQASTLIRKLRNNGDCRCRVVGVDMNEGVIGQYWSDAFYRIPQAGAKGYVERIKEIIAKEKPDALLNVSEMDVPPLAAIKSDIERMGTKFIGPSAEAVAILTSKYKLYERFRNVPGVKIPEYTTPKTLPEFVDMARAMGYPKRDLCFKPYQSKGTRGFRILTETQSKRDLLLNQKPTARYMSMNEFVSIFEGDPDFPQLLLMEVVAGEELDCMAVAYQGEALLCTVKSRESHRWGVIDKGELVRRPEIVEVMKRISENLSLSYNILFQFIDGYLIEMGPRTSTYIFDDHFIEPWIAIKIGIGMMTPAEVRALQDKIPYGRRLLRYMEQIAVAPDGSWSH